MINFPKVQKNEERDPNLEGIYFKRGSLKSRFSSTIPVKNDDEKLKQLNKIESTIAQLEKVPDFGYNQTSMQFENIGLWKFCFDYVGSRPRFERFENIVQEKHCEKKVTFHSKNQSAQHTKSVKQSRIIHGKQMLSPQMTKTQTNSVERYSLEMNEGIKGLYDQLEKTNLYFKKFKKDFQGYNIKPKPETKTASFSLLNKVKEGQENDDEIIELEYQVQKVLASYYRRIQAEINRINGNTIFENLEKQNRTLASLRNFKITIGILLRAVKNRQYFSLDITLIDSFRKFFPEIHDLKPKIQILYENFVLAPSSVPATTKEKSASRLAPSASVKILTGERKKHQSQLNPRSNKYKTQNQTERAQTSGDPYWLKQDNANSSVSPSKWSTHEFSEEKKVLYASRKKNTEAVAQVKTDQVGPNNLNRIKQANSSPYLDKVEQNQENQYQQQHPFSTKAKSIKKQVPQQQFTQFFKTSKKNFKNSQNIYKAPFTPKLNTSTEHRRVMTIGNTGASTLGLKKKKETAATAILSARNTEKVQQHQQQKQKVVAKEQETVSGVEEVAEILATSLEL